MSNELSLAKQLSVAVAIASEAHEKQLDRGGKPYILHPLRVMMKFQGDVKSMMVAVLHDVIEDSAFTEDDLRARGVTNKDVLQALQLITKDDNMDYALYIEMVKSNVYSKKVKMEDIRDNSDLTRLKGVRQKDLIRAQKYNAAYMYLNDRITLEEFKSILCGLGVI